MKRKHVHHSRHQEEEVTTDVRGEDRNKEKGKKYVIDQIEKGDRR